MVASSDLDALLTIVETNGAKLLHMRDSDVRRYVPDLAATWPLDEPTSARHDATVLFADVAGFTKLSERLAKLGPEGSEAVKEIINAVFEPTLDAVLRGGGDVVKFAGDGFLSMFVGDDHAARAARAAASMQRSMRELATFRTPAGRVRPRLTVGAETGAVDVVALGQPGLERRDIVAIGAVIDRVFEIESAASNGQVGIGERLMTALDPRWIARNSSDDDAGRLRITRVPGQPARRLVRVSTNERALEFLDPAVAHVVTRGSSPAEHRTVAVAFVIVDHVAADSADGADPGASAKRLNAIASDLARACREHDVCWLETDSEHDRIRFLLTVGAPQRREHDTERLLDVVSAVVGSHGLRAGVARGRAFVGDVGHPERRTYNVMGPVVNLAARLAGNAAAGSTLVPTDVAELITPEFFLTPSPPLQLKGFAGAVAVAELGDRRPSRIDVSARGPLHGREDELQTCTELVERLRDGVGGAVEIVADAGVGKSRLVEEIERTAPCAVYRADGRRDREAIPYGAIAPLVRAVLGIPTATDSDDAGRVVLGHIESVAAHLLPVAPLIAIAAHATVPDTIESDAVARPFRGTRTREVVLELFEATAPTPTIFLAEDMHWFDEASRLLLTAIAISARERPWLVVGTRRPVADPPDGFDAIRLEPLAAEVIRRLVIDEIGDAAMSRRQIDEIVRAAEGNPLFASELARAAIRATGSTLPDRVEDIIASRIDDLDLDSRSMLRDLSVAGVEPDAATLKLLLDEHGMGDEALGVIRDFVTITSSGAQFRHELYRRAAYEGLPVGRRRALHRRLASQLAERDDATQHAAAIAEHAHHGRDAPATWLWTRAAAAEALAQGATHEAAIHLQRGLQALPAVDVGPFDEARTAEMLGDALELAGRPDEAHAAYRRARRALADLPIECARLCRKHARVDERAGRYRASLRWTTKGLQLLDEHPNDEIAAELRLAAGVLRFFQGHFDESIALATAAAEAAERVGATMALAQAHLQLEMVYSELGWKVERARHGAYALGLFERLDDRLGLANLHLNLGVSQYNEANWPQALDHYERSAHYYRLVGDTIGAEAARNNRAEILTDQGRLDEAASVLVDVERALKAARYQLGVAITTSGRARVALHCGRLTTAEALLEEARRAFGELDARHMVLDTDVRRVEHLVWAGRIDEAVALAESAERDLAELGPVAVLPATLARLRGWAALHVGDADLAARHFSCALELARAEEFTYEVVLAHDALLLAGRGEAERLDVDRQFDELGVVAPPRPPWAPTA